MNNSRKIRWNRIAAFVLATVLFMGAGLSLTQQAAYGADASFEASLTAQGFPESYKVYLRQLHEAHPNWIFKAKLLDFTWDDALTEQYADAGANTISVNYKDTYKAVREGAYNFSTHTYLPKDGASWVSASKQAVAFYMDPRNWLTETGIFMFEPFYYDASYQTESAVKSILSGTALPASASAYYMEAAQQTYNGKTYSISPIYLATKTRIELGSYSTMIDGHSFSYGGKNFSKCYNVYNIGAVDSADGTAATKGLVYAAGGIDQSGTSYLRPWNTLKKAVMGGAVYIADNFFSNNQYSAYYERFNVLNGLSAIGTHQYATSVFCAATEASIMGWNYKDSGILDEAFTFEIPVYQNMPSTPCAQPPSEGTNNCYLDSITVSADGKTLSFSPSFDRFTSTYTVSGTVAADKLTIKTVKNDSTSTVTITGNSLVNGENKISVKCTSSSGLESKTYYIKVVRDGSQSTTPVTSSENLIKGVENTTISLAQKEQGDGYVRVAWEKSKGYKVDYFQVFRTTKGSAFGSSPLYTTTSGTVSTYKNTKSLTKGTTYSYKIRGVRVIDGKTYYTNWSNTVDILYNPVSESLIQGVENTTLNMAAVQGNGFVQTSWEKSPGYKMDYYEVFRSSDPEAFEETPYFTTADGIKVTYKNSKDLVRNNVYYYRVRGVRVLNGVTHYSQWSNVVAVEYNPYIEGIALGVENTTLTASGAVEGKGIRVSWTKSPGYKMDYYEVFRSVKKSSGYGTAPIYTTTDGTKVTYKNTKDLTKGTRYYYKVRGVRIMEGQPYYTQWSTKADVMYE